MVRPLVRALVDLMVFLEFSRDDVVNPDAAVTQIEAVAAILREQPQDDRAVLIDEIVAVGKEQQDPAVREFVVGLPESLGLL